MQPFALKQEQSVANSHACNVGHYVFAGFVPFEHKARLVGLRHSPHTFATFKTVWDVEFREHALRGRNISVHGIRPYRVHRVAQVFQRRTHGARHYRFGYTFEYRATTCSAGSRRVFTYAHYTTVLGIVGGEIAHKGYKVFRRAPGLGPYLRRSRLACYPEVLRPYLLARAFFYNQLQTHLYIVQCLGRAHSFAHYRHGVFLYHFAVFHQRLDKARAQHLSPVGYTVVKSQGAYRRNLRLVSYAHPCECRFRPVLAVLHRAAYARAGVARNGKLQILCQAYPVKPVNEFLGLVIIELVDKIAYSHIRRLLYAFGSSKNSETSHGTPVAVFHVPAVHVLHTVSGIYYVVHVEVTVVHGNHERSRFEHRTGLKQVAHRVIARLAVFAVAAARHVHYRLYISRTHFHKHGQTYGRVNFL